MQLHVWRFCGLCLLIAGRPMHRVGVWCRVPIVVPLARTKYPARVATPCVLGPAGRRQMSSCLEVAGAGGMDLTALARRLALAFASGKSNDALSAAVEALLPSASYVRCAPEVRACLA